MNINHSIQIYISLKKTFQKLFYKDESCFFAFIRTKRKVYPFHLYLKIGCHKRIKTTTFQRCFQQNLLSMIYICFQEVLPLSSFYKLHSTNSIGNKLYTKRSYPLRHLSSFPLYICCFFRLHLLLWSWLISGKVTVCSISNLICQGGT